MKRGFIQKGFVCFLIFVLMIGLIQKPAAAAAPIDINANAVILVDADTGKILYEQNSETVLGIASMTKMMTEYLLLEAVKEGKVKWDQEFTISPELSKMSHDNKLSNVPLRVGASYKVEDLYAAMAIESANAATLAIAEVVAGTEANFVKMMNEKAAQLGLKDFKFVNSTGLNNRDVAKHFPEIVGGADEENVMSARAVAKLAYQMLKDFPEVLNTSSIPEKTFAKDTEDKFVMDNWNWMLEGYRNIADRYPNYQQFTYEGLDGLKTGSTNFAGYCFTGTAERDGQRFITVVMGTKSNAERFVETKKLMDFAFNSFKKEELIPKHYQVKGSKTLPVAKGKEDSVKIYTKDAIQSVVGTDEKDQYEFVLEIDKKKLNEDGALTAPIKKGDKVGTLTIKPKEGEEANYLSEEGQKSTAVDVIAANDVEKANWFILMMRGIGGFFGDIWGSVSSAVKGWF
ncbi:D-alanyl-D-alanine carboxypeptidase family protein [Robertmurraya andreesenii]|uniref:serine-type D-Ala-D-Ala carboxypeptidase n=1 Tax=Anoxybacillus andreesenii TaxID=1325932 RepID=A0ABT9VA92_9BACL|nr:D-alanyl-D-alanine carboxypeptidase family protein [Robertmurraya andreesenii]MDQ0157882.1 D-alanyl-D-alanine carboxypeptidase (penicillin-binding protein 5/6) [Robertmurraya andreesenii]